MFIEPSSGDKDDSCMNVSFCKARFAQADFPAFGSLSTRILPFRSFDNADTFF